MKNKELLIKALQAQSKDCTNELIKQFLLSNEKTETKFDLYQFTNNKGLRAFEWGIMHKDGYMYATDSHILARVKAEYNQDLEECFVTKKGEIYQNEKLPPFDAVIPNIDDIKPLKIDFKKVLEIEKQYKIDRKADDDKNKVYVIKINDRYFNIKLFSVIARFSIAYKIEDIYLTSTTKTAIIQNKELDATAIIMPIILNDKYSAKIYEL